MTTDSLTGLSGNILLGSLSVDDAVLIMPNLEEVSLAQGDVIMKRGAPVTHAYFPDTAVLSVINYMNDGSAVEMGTTGNEGFSGISLVLETDTSMGTTICQIPGIARRLPAQVITDTCEDSPTLRRLRLSPRRQSTANWRLPSMPRNRGPGK